MLRIRLARMGRKKRPHYRVVVAEARWARDGRRVDDLGWYNPLTDPSTVVLDVERTEDWIRKGAQPSERVSKLLAIAKEGTGGPGAKEPPRPSAAAPRVAKREPVPAKAAVEPKPAAARVDDPGTERTELAVTSVADAREAPTAVEQAGVAAEAEGAAPVAKAAPKAAAKPKVEATAKGKSKGKGKSKAAPKSKTGAKAAAKAKSKSKSTAKPKAKSKPKNGASES